MNRERTYFYEVTLQLDCGEAVVEVSLADGASDDAIYDSALAELVSQCRHAKLGSIRKGGWIDHVPGEPGETL